MEKREKFIISLVLLIGFFEFYANIWGLSIYSLDEAKNATCAKEMIQRGDYIVPTFNYELRTDKPPVHYYFMIVAYKLFGFSEFSARFFSSLFGVLTVLITYLFARKTLGLEVALLSSIVLISSFHTVLQFHMAVPDPYLIFFLNAVFFSFYIWFKQRKELFLYLMYASMGIGVLTKGPVAVVLPSVIVLLYLVYMHSFDLRTLLQLKIPRGIFIILLISLPWYIAVGIKTDWVWVYEFIFKHNIGRFSHPMEGHGGSFLLPFIFVFVGLLPFSIFLIHGFIHAWKDKFHDVLVFLGIVSVVYIGFFSISGTKLPNYTTPTYPAIAVILAYFLSKIKKSDYKRTGIVWLLILYIAITSAISIFVYIALKNDNTLSHVSYVGLTFLIWTIGGVVALIFLLRGRLKETIISLSVFSVIFITVFFFFALPKIDRENPVVKILPLIDKSKPIAYYKGFNPAFAFYLGTPIPKLETVEDVKTFLSRNERVYILTRKKYLNKLRGIKGLKVVSMRKDLFEKTTSVLISNK